MSMSAQEQTLSYQKPTRLASRYKTFKSTVYAMNTLLVPKGSYTQDEFQKLFRECTKKTKYRRRPARGVSPSRPEFS
jgi:hypothetical protein